MSSIRNKVSEPEISGMVFSLKFLGQNKPRDDREIESNDHILKIRQKFGMGPCSVRQVRDNHRSHWILSSQWIWSFFRNSHKVLSVIYNVGGKRVRDTQITECYKELSNLVNARKLSSWSSIYKADFNTNLLGSISTGRETVVNTTVTEEPYESKGSTWNNEEHSIRITHHPGFSSESGANSLCRLRPKQNKAEN